jgi:hypothetical protein
MIHLRAGAFNHNSKVIPFQDTHNDHTYGRYKQLNHGTMQRGKVIKKEYDTNLLKIPGKLFKTSIRYCDFQNNSYDKNNLEKQSPASWVCFDEGTRKIKMVYSLPAYIYTNFDACYNGDDQINAFIKDCTENQKGYANLLPLKDTELNDAYPAWASNPGQPMAEAMASWKSVSPKGELGTYSPISMDKADLEKLAQEAAKTQTNQAS